MPQKLMEGVFDHSAPDMPQKVEIAIRQPRVLGCDPDKLVFTELLKFRMGVPF